MIFGMRSPLMDPDPAQAGGGDPAPPFDIAKAFADLSASVNKTLNGFDSKWSKRLDKAPAPAPAPVDPTTDPDPATGAPVDPKAAALERKYKESMARAEALEKNMAERESKAAEREKQAMQKLLMGETKAEIGKYVDPVKAAAAFALLKDQVRYDEDGQMVGPDDSPLVEWVKSEFARKDFEWMLPARPVSGAGATAGGNRNSAVQFEDIKSGMAPDKLAAVRAEIARVAKEAMGG